MQDVTRCCWLIAGWWVMTTCCAPSRWMVSWEHTQLGSTLTIVVPAYLYLATPKMWCWSGGIGILGKLSLCCSIVYCCNCA